MEATMSYIGRKPCGCVVCAVVDDPHRKKDVARYLAEWVKRGMTVERVDVDYVRENFVANCQHEIKPQSPLLTLFG